jgi:purine-binding chemotaxis protein CheW
MPLEKRRNLLLFRLERQSYALPVEAITQIIPMVVIAHIPQVSEAVEGVVNVHGELVPVINLGRHIGQRATPRRLHTPIILTRSKEMDVGLIVDEVLDVFHFAEKRIKRPTDILPEGMGEANILQGLTYSQGETVLLLDLDHLFQPQQVEALAQAMDIMPEEGNEFGGEIGERA